MKAQSLKLYSTEDIGEDTLNVLSKQQQLMLKLEVQGVLSMVTTH
jgi:hypothetical protein